MNKAIPQKIFFTLWLIFFLPLSFKMVTAHFYAAEADRYKEINCRIVKNEWGSNTDDSKLILDYVYNFGDKNYHSNRYQWGFTDFSGGREGTKNFLRQYPPGSVSPCFVNVKNPEYVVIKKGAAYYWYESLVLVLFLSLGLWGWVISFFDPERAMEMFTSSDGDSGGD